MTEASGVPDTALGLWLELFEKFGDEPFYVSEDLGELQCIFCGSISPSVEDQQHRNDCIWVRAKAITGWGT